MSANEMPKGLSFRPNNIRTPKNVRDQRALEAQEREEEDYWWKYHGIPPEDQDRTRHNLSIGNSFSNGFGDEFSTGISKNVGSKVSNLSCLHFVSSQVSKAVNKKISSRPGALNPPYFEYRCPGKREFDEQVHQSFYQAQHLTVPVFKDIIILLLGRMVNDEFEELKSMNFPETISKWGSLHEIAEIAIAQILPQFLELQGKPLTAEIIHKIHQDQFEDPIIWTEKDIGGYVLIGLDDRDKYYIRYYIGQSFRLSTRVCIQHAEAIWNSDTRRLCYYVLTKGKGYRSASFVRLWSTDFSTIQTLPDKQIELLQNVLEMVFCLTFESLPASVLKAFLGRALEDTQI
uniref:Uncharacterized protein n=1 Tax=Bionectria ochroleuca TaxID=29856 RepID=A0A8H7NKH2_BIOOC